MDSTEAEKGRDTQRTERAITEAQTQTRGLWMCIFGVALAALTMGAGLLWDSSTGEEMPSIVILPLYGTSFAAIALGCSERLGRIGRRQRRELFDQQLRIEAGLLKLVDMMPEERRREWYAAYATGVRDVTAKTGTEDTGGHRLSGPTGIVRPIRE